MSVRRILIVGASVAGVQAAESLRTMGFEGDVIVLDAQDELPYNRPPLSKELLTGELDEDDIRLLTPQLVDELVLDLRLASPARHLDLNNCAVHTEHGEIPYDQLVIATGAAPIMPTPWTDVPNVMALRTLADARCIHTAFSTGRPTVVVVGGGFIGCELAAAARQRGLDVTIVEAESQLMARALPPSAAAPLQTAHIQAGVHLRLGAAVAALHGAGPVERVELADGQMLDADLVVVGIGARPATTWLSGSGLAIDDGVLTDETLRARRGVYAIGDVARWSDHRRPQSQRVEHWTNARAHGVVVAHNLLHPDTPRIVSDLPYVWSDQYGRRLQIIGDSLADDVAFVTQGPMGAGYLALIGDGKHVVGAVGYAQERSFRRARKVVADHARWDEVDQLAW